MTFKFCVTWSGGLGHNPNNNGSRAFEELKDAETFFDMQQDKGYDVQLYRMRFRVGISRGEIPSS